MDKSKAESVHLLKTLISIPSFSREEKEKSDFIEQYLTSKGCVVHRVQNNLWCAAAPICSKKPTLLLNSHIDTVKPTGSWTKTATTATEENGRIYGIGANDAHASVVTLIATFLLLKNSAQPYNLILALSAEEEVSGKNGMELLRHALPKVDFAVVGEPTKMQAAVAEKGLMVIDGTAHGKSGHAAREEGVNAIYTACNDVEWIRSFRFPKTSALLGHVKMTVTQINAGIQHNVIPDECRFVVDVRSNGLYTNQELYTLMQSYLQSEIKARSFRLNPSHLDEQHPMFVRLRELGFNTFGSATISDQALMDFPSMKIGPGDSARSHTADEYIEINEIGDGIEKYFKLLNQFQL